MSKENEQTISQSLDELLNFGISTPSAPTGSPKNAEKALGDEPEVVEEQEASVEGVEDAGVGENEKDGKSVEKPAADPGAHAELLAQVNKTVADAVKSIEKPEPAAEIKPLEFSELTEDEFNAAITTREGLNKALRKVYELGVAHSIEQSMLKVAPIVQSQVQQYVAINNMVSDFYKNNEDLIPYRNFVGFISNQLASAHPDWGYAKLFEESEKEVRKQLGSALQKNAQEQGASANKAKKPAFARPAGGRQPAVEVSDKQKKLAAVLGI
jgi:hypothetical protein